jgi:hypothetical protein
VTPDIAWLQENGYELLFLSARAISQADLTRQFLFSVKQVTFLCVQYVITYVIIRLQLFSTPLQPLSLQKVLNGVD